MDPRQTRIAALKNALKERIVILDGAMGTMLQREEIQEATFRGTRFLNHPKDLRGNFDVLNITNPQIVQKVQRAYFEAGAEIIKTNTFNSNAISALDYGLESIVHELNVAGARSAREVADEFAAAQVWLMKMLPLLQPALENLDELLDVVGGAGPISHSEARFDQVANIA